MSEILPIIAKHAGGRPTSYDPSYCEEVIAWGAQGKSKVWMATEIGVCRNTLDNWCRDHPEFLNSFTLAMELSQRWWEDGGQEGMVANCFNGTVWSRNMAARFPDDWRETSRKEVSGPGGRPIMNANLNIDVTRMTDEELEAYGRLCDKFGTAQDPSAVDGSVSEGEGQA